MLTPKEPSHPPNRPSFADGPSLALARDQGAPSFVHGRPPRAPKVSPPAVEPRHHWSWAADPTTRLLGSRSAGLLGCPIRASAAARLCSQLATGQ